MKTVVTFTIDHDDLNQDWKKQIDMHVGEATLKFYESYAWHLVRSAASCGLATVTVEVAK